jgi:hypothetical protein
MFYTQRLKKHQWQYITAMYNPANQNNFDELPVCISPGTRGKIGRY